MKLSVISNLKFKSCHLDHNQAPGNPHDCWISGCFCFSEMTVWSLFGHYFKITPIKDDEKIPLSAYFYACAFNDSSRACAADASAL